MCQAPLLGPTLKGQGKTGRSKFLLCPLRGSFTIWPIHFICGTHTTHQVTLCRASFPDQKVKGQSHKGRSKFLPCPLRGSIPIWPIHSICGTHTTHEVAICSVQLLGQKFKGHTVCSKFLPCLIRVLRTNFQAKRSRSRRSCEIFRCVRYVALSLFDRFTLYVVHAKPMRWLFVAHHLQVMISKVKVTRSFKALSCPLYGSVPIWPIHFKCGTYNQRGDDVLCTISMSKGLRSHRWFICKSWAFWWLRGDAAIRFLDLLV